MSELFRPKTREQLLAETWEPVETWQLDEGSPVYTIMQSCHGWYRWHLYDEAQRCVGFTTGRFFTIEEVKDELYFLVEEERS